MASTQLCIQQKSFLLAGSFNRACVDTRTNLLPPSQRYAKRSATHGVARAALAAASLSTEGSVKSSLEGLLQEARMQKGRASMRAWCYMQHMQKAEKEAEIADSSYAQAEEAAHQMEMEEGRAVMRIWWLDRQLRVLDPSRPPLPPVKRTRRVHPVRRSPGSGPKQAITVAEGKAVSSGQREEPVTASEEHPAPSEVKTMAMDTASAQEAATPVGDPVSVDAEAERQRKMDAGRANMRNWWTQEQEASKRAVEGTVSEERSALSESKTITTDTIGAQEPAAPPDKLISIEAGKGEEAAQAERQKIMDAGRAKMREWWIQEQEATKRSLGLQGTESKLETITTDTTRAKEVATPVDDLVSTEVRKEQEAAQTERQRKMDAGRAKMREWWTQQMQATGPALETKAISTDATGAQQPATPADDPVSIDVQKEPEAAQEVLLEGRAKQQRRMDAGRANMRKWWQQEQEATQRKLELQEVESKKLSAASEAKAITTDTTRAQELAAPVDDLLSTEVQKEQDAAQTERQRRMDEGRANMRNWWRQEQEAAKRKLELHGVESEKRPAPSEVKTITTDTTTAQGVAAPEEELVSVEAQAERQEKMDSGRARLREWWIKEQEATKPAPKPHRTESDERPAPSESKTVTAGTTGAQKLPSPLDILVKIEVRKEREAAQRRALEAQAERQRTMDAGRAKMRKWWIKEREATKRALGLAPYGPVWTVVRNDEQEPPISIGKTPLIIGAEVDDTENMIPVKLDYPTVSGVHAKIFAKEVLSYGEYVRAYFVVDLKSTNGVRRNNNFRLRPGTQYKLSHGDTLCFGEEAATIVIRNPQKNP